MAFHRRPPDFTQSPGDYLTDIPFYAAKTKARETSEAICLPYRAALHEEDGRSDRWHGLPGPRPSRPKRLECRTARRRREVRTPQRHRRHRDLGVCVFLILGSVGGVGTVVRHRASHSAWRLVGLDVGISELVTNALKYGKGVIGVEVKVHNDDLRITVCDEGSGFPETYPKPSGTGLGMRLVRSYSG